LIQQPEMRMAFGRNALGRVHKLFTWERVCSAIEQLYADIAGDRRHGMPTALPIHSQLTV
jgi:hypothetical protein